MKKVLIAGITGQDGSCLAERLLSKGYEVHGMIRRSSSLNTARINLIYRDSHEKHVRLFLHYGDLNDASCNPPPKGHIQDSTEQITALCVR